MYAKRIGLILVVLVLSLALGVTIGRKMGVSSDGEMSLVSYEVAPDKAENIRNALSSILVADRDQLDGRVQLIGSTTLIVKTKAAMQKGIADFIKDYSAQKGGRSPIYAEYWMVVAEPGESNAQSLQDLKPVLESINKNQGNRTYRVIEKLASTMMDSERSEIRGGQSQLKTRASVIEDRVHASIEISSSLSSIESDIKSAPGEFIVLGQSAVRSNSAANELGVAINAEIYHILRTSVIQ